MPDFLHPAKYMITIEDLEQVSSLIFINTVFNRNNKIRMVVVHMKNSLANTVLLQTPGRND